MNSIRDEISSIDAQWVESITSKDITAILSLYDSGAVFMVPGRPALEGQDAIRAAWEDMLGLPEFQLLLDPIMIEASGDGRLAIDRGSYRLSFSSADGPVVDIGKYLVVWQRSDAEGWRIHTDIFNSDGPA